MLSKLLALIILLSTNKYDLMVLIDQFHEFDAEIYCAQKLINIFVIVLYVMDWQL